MLAIAATLTMTVSYADRHAFAVLQPSFTKALSISDSELGLLQAAFSVTYLFGAPLAGAFIDRVGARRGLLGAVLVWSVISAAHAAAPGFAAFFALRIALGFAESPSFPGSVQTVSRALPAEERPRGFGVLFVGSSVGALIVTPLASFVAARWDYKVAFLVSSAVGLLWVPMWLSTSFRAEARALLDAKDETKAEAPSKLALLQNRDVLRAMIAVVASAPAIAFVLNWGSKYFTKELGLGQAEVGKWLWIPPVVFDLGSVLFGDLATRLRKRRGGALVPERGLMLAAAALCSLLCLLPLMHDAPTAVVVASVSMAGGGAMYALLTSDMMARVPPAAVATAGGICAAAQSICHIAFLPLVGFLSQRLGGYAVPTVALGLWVLPFAVLWCLVPPRPAADDHLGKA